MSDNNSFFWYASSTFGEKSTELLEYSVNLYESFYDEDGSPKEADFDKAENILLDSMSKVEETKRLIIDILDQIKILEEGTNEGL